MLNIPPIRKAPTLLFARRAPFLTVIGAGVILGLATALAPMFLSSAASATLGDELDRRCPASYAATSQLYAYRSDEGDFRVDVPLSRDILRAATEDDPAFGEPFLTLVGPYSPVTRVDGDGREVTMVLLAREGFRDHIELVAGEHGEGVYVDDTSARTLGLSPGDRVSVIVPVVDEFGHGGEESAEPTVTELPVSGIYRNLFERSSDPYWCAVRSLLQLSNTGDRPPAPMLIDTDYFPYDSDEFQAGFVRFNEDIHPWEIPILTEKLTVTGAINAGRTIDYANENFVEFYDEILGDDSGIEVGGDLVSDLPLIVERTRALTASLTTSVTPLALVVIIAATGLVGAAGSYWVDRRRGELELLSVSGVSPGAIGYKAALEFFIPLLAGAALGWIAANLLVGLVAPSPNVELSARIDGAALALGMGVVGLLLVMSVAAIRATRLLDTRRYQKAGLSLRWPLILLSFAAAELVRRSIGDEAVVTGEGELVGSVNPLVLFYPILALIGVALLTSTLLSYFLRALRGVRGKSHSRYLALRRMASAGSAAMVLILGVALAVSVLLYSTNLARSATLTVDAKGKTFVGGDNSTLVYGLGEIPPPLVGNATIVLKVERGSLNDEVVDLIAVDRDTFADGAFWVPGYARKPLATVLDELAAESSGSLPVYVANGDVVDGELNSSVGSLDITVIGTLDAFPGEVRDRPLLIIDRDKFVAELGEEGDVRRSRHLLWSSGVSEDEVEAALVGAGIGFAFTTPASETLDLLRFAAIVWTFEFLEAYSALAGLIVIAAVLLYTDTRQRSRNLSYALARRMGLTSTEHRAALILEIGILTGLGSVVGIAVGWVSSNLVYKSLDPVPITPPDARWVWSPDVILATLVATILLALIASALAQRTADGADVSDLLRHGD